jgi:uncharacterized protein (DUF2267 family)
VQYDQFIAFTSARAGRPRRPPTQETQPLQVQDFVRRVAEQAHVDEGEARGAVPGVLTTTREAVSPGEWEDVASQMGRELDVLTAGAQ